VDLLWLEAVRDEQESTSRVPMSFGALTETTLPLSWLTWVIGDPPLTSRVRTFGCR
jgi:hypothetical protein